MAANYHYSQADYYYSKESLVTSSLSSLQSASGRTPFVGPHGRPLELYNDSTFQRKNYSLVNFATAFDQNQSPVQFVGKVDAENKTIALGEGARLVLEHFDSANTCVMIPSECSSGLTVATWARNNLFLEEGDLPIFIVSYVVTCSHFRDTSLNSGTGCQLV